MRQRLQTVADCLAEKNITLTMETGQEPADVLLRFIADVGRPNVKVNFDPGNVILYGIGDPVEAAEKLAPHIAHMHCKDATASDQPGVTWGQEVPLGQGQARLGEVIKTLKSRGYKGPLVIEREAGADRIGDIRSGIQFLNGVLAEDRQGRGRGSRHRANQPLCTALQETDLWTCVLMAISLRPKPIVERADDLLVNGNLRPGRKSIRGWDVCFHEMPATALRTSPTGTRIEPTGAGHIEISQSVRAYPNRRYRLDVHVETAAGTAETKTLAGKPPVAPGEPSVVPRAGSDAAPSRCASPASGQEKRSARTNRQSWHVGGDAPGDSPGDLPVPAGHGAAAGAAAVPGKTSRSS